MKIYLSNKKNTDERMIHCSNIISLDQTVLDGEAREIVIDNFISSFAINETRVLLEKILKKSRLNSEITIIDSDFDLLCLKHYRGELNLENTNNYIFSSMNSIKSVINLAFIMDILKSNQNIEIMSVNVDYSNCCFTIKIRRSK